MAHDTELTDESLMPFGAHRGKKMLNVPASYFHYLWTHGMETDFASPVANYIRKSLSALKKDHPDGIW